MNHKTLLIAAIIGLAAAGNAFAHCGTCGVGEPKAAEGKPAEGTHAMNTKTCACGMPLSDEKGKSTHVEYNGKIYHFCSLDCAEYFKQNAEEMSKKLSGEPVKTEEAAKE